jgi:probable nitrogen fixation protein
VTESNLGPFLCELVRQIRAQDTYGLWDGKPDQRLLAPFVIDRQKARTIPLSGDPEPQVLARLDQFYGAVALSIEKRCGLMAFPVLQLTPEGFGRIVLVCGRLTVLKKTLRDVHRFGFASLEKLEAEGEALVGAALQWIERFPDCSRAE